MPVERVFLGWDVHQPALRQVSVWLWERFPPDEATWDLSAVVLATPGARAGRRLLEILVEQSVDRALCPPKIVTLGALPQYLYSSTERLADELTVQLARAQALRSADRAMLAHLAPHPPDDEDISAWLALARLIDQTDADLRAQGMSFADAAERLSNRLNDFHDQPRWSALVQLQNDYEKLLAQAGLRDQRQARDVALKNNACRTDNPIVLIACADLNGQLRAMLQQAVERLSQNITALIHAPQDFADRFDDLGALIVEQWRDQPLMIDDQAIHVADRPRDQAMSVLSVLSQWSEPSSLSLDEVTVGLGDAALGAAVERTLTLAGLPAHSPQGQPVALLAPVMAFSALGRFAGSRRFDDLATLLRHPDVEAYVMRAITGSEPEMVRRAIDNGLNVLDKYATQTLQRRLTGSWLGEAQLAESMRQVHDAVVKLIPDDCQQSKRLPQWCEPIADGLRKIYGDRTLARFDEVDAAIIEALDALRGALQSAAQLDADWSFSPKVTFSQAVSLIGSQLTSAQTHVAQSQDQPAIELLGYLELQLDDAPMLVIVGMNEGAVPQTRLGDALLPDSSRRLLGLPDNDHRYARDRLALEAMIRSRPRVALVAGRRSVRDDPLKPSRLLLACPTEALPARIHAFYAKDSTESGADNHAAASLLSVSEQSAFGLIAPESPKEPIRQLRVTAFREYIACPYRFYLKYVVGLTTLDDNAVEMGGGAFGTLAHEVLQRFARSGEAAQTDPAKITTFLNDQLSNLAQHRYGQASTAAVRLQIEQLRRRLDIYANWQAEQTQLGWRIDPDHVERRYEAELIVDEKPFTVTGHIDRIDRHDQYGWRLIDFKTWDAPKTPDKQHRQGGRNDKQWTDLQLPLYRTLAQSAGVGEPMTLGYMQLPKDLSKIGFDPANWDQAMLDDAINDAQQIIRKIRARRFWPPNDPPKFDDGLRAICLDDCLDRAQAIERMDAALSYRGGEHG